MSYCRLVESVFMSLLRLTDLVSIFSATCSEMTHWDTNTAMTVRFFQGKMSCLKWGTLLYLVTTKAAQLAGQNHTRKRYL